MGEVLSFGSIKRYRSYIAILGECKITRKSNDQVEKAYGAEWALQRVVRGERRWGWGGSGSGSLGFLLGERVFPTHRPADPWNMSSRGRACGGRLTR